jgi:hypothetical protein
VTATLGVVREPSWADVLLWFETLDALIRGLGHSLNNRALALGATIESLDHRLPLGPELVAGLTRESERMTEQLRQLRSLPFALEREPLPLLLSDVLAVAIQLHRSHASLGDIPTYLDGSRETPPVLAPESSLLHATLVTLTALKRFVAPGGVVRVEYAGSPDRAQVSFVAHRDPADSHDPAAAVSLIQPMTLAASLLSGAALEIEQELTPEAATIVWTMPSLRVMRKRGRAKT